MGGGSKQKCILNWLQNITNISQNYWPYSVFGVECTLTSPVASQNKNWQQQLIWKWEVEVAEIYSELVEK
jgi:hypothetical protein